MPVAHGSQQPYGGSACGSHSGRRQRGQARPAASSQREQRWLTSWTRYGIRIKHSKLSMSDTTRVEYLRLVDEIAEHDRRYHVDNDPTISDVEYDRLVTRLRALEDQHPELVVDWSPTRRVAPAPASDFPKVVRAVPMLSLDNTYDEAELRAFHDRVVRGLDGDQPSYVI